MALHLTKVAFGAASLDVLAERLQARAAAGACVVTTRFLPKRHGEVLEGGSLFWIIRHQLVARSPIMSFGTTAEGRVAIHVDPALRLVLAQPRRAHQGWRYLEPHEAPGDLGGAAAEGIAAMPPALVGRLAELALI